MISDDRIGKIRASIDRQCLERGYAAPVDVLIDIGLIDKKKHEDWRRGRIPYLEAVCNINLHKLAEVMKSIRRYGRDSGLVPSVTDYRQWGATQNRLRFSKSGDPDTERHYSTHWVKKKPQTVDRQEDICQEG